MSQQDRIADDILNGGEQMRRFLVSWFFLLVVLPFAVAGLYSLAERNKEPENEISELQISVQTAGGEKRMGVTEYLTGVVAGQIPAEYEMETLKAQAIIARTCLYEKAGNRPYIDAAETGLEWRSESERRELWGAQYQANNEKIGEAVRATDGLVLRYDGKLILPAWFALGSGCTRSSLEAWKVDIPWLQSVDSAWDTESEQYETVIVKTKRQLITELKRGVKDFNCSSDSLASTCQITETDSSGYVLQMQIGNKILSGDDFRYALDLPSSCFDLDFVGNTVTITVRGDGHGVGFDQYGANSQAQEGKKCEELLLYYLTDAKVSE